MYFLYIFSKITTIVAAFTNETEECVLMPFTGRELSFFSLPFWSNKR